MSATLLPAKGSPPAADATELAVRPSVCEVIHDQGSGVVTFDRETVESLLASGRFFWLDLGYPTRGDFDILREVFKFHPLALEDPEQFNQQAKIDGYDDFVFIVIYGAGPDDDRLVEVHCFYSERFLITVHRDDCPAFAEIGRRYRKRERAIDHPSLLLYRVCRWPRRQLLPEPRRVRRPHRRTRGRDLPEGRREPAPRDLPDEATPRRDAEDRDATARRLREPDGRRRRTARTRRGGRALLPRRL
ncbi:MAG: hypothetical protein E6G19_12290 [Actinobacteria bacterium]|nr:MAG: hypothetical protein E6G19_12290 [Actinomycetota bacterium]